MKTKTLFFVVVLINVVVIFSSCERQSGRRVKSPIADKVETVAKIKTADTLLFTPDKIGATELIKVFTPYPNFDGGTGMEINFFIGVQYKEKTYEVKCGDLVFFGENLTQIKAEKNQRINDVVLAHYLIKNTPISYLDVLVVNGEVVKIYRRSSFIANEFYPEKVIWVKK